MQPPRKPDDETQRLRALKLMQVLDTPGDEKLDRVTSLASKLFNVPIALVSLVDDDRQWFKSRHGLEATETPRAVSFCGHAILGDDLFVVPDASADPRFHDNPLVTSDPNVRFYAGYPLKTRSGHRVGTLCVIDNQARTFDEKDRDLLRDLGQLAEQQLQSIALASTDELTQISNRRGFMQLATQGLAAANRAGQSSVVLMFDLNDFKKLNDELGHAAGDKALIMFARCLLLTCRQSDALGRLGGDEFSVFMPNANVEGAKTLMLRLVEQVARVNAAGVIPAQLQFSVGMAVADPTLNLDVDALLAHADAKMYANKRREHR